MYQSTGSQPSDPARYFWAVYEAACELLPGGGGATAVAVLVEAGALPRRRTHVRPRRTADGARQRRVAEQHLRIRAGERFPGPSEPPVRARAGRGDGRVGHQDAVGVRAVRRGRGDRACGAESVVEDLDGRVIED